MVLESQLLPKLVHERPEDRHAAARTSMIWKATGFPETVSGFEDRGVGLEMPLPPHPRPASAFMQISSLSLLGPVDPSYRALS